MQARHNDSEAYFHEQAATTRKYVIPFIIEGYALSDKTVVAEIGCGIGGNMLPFLEMGCDVSGIDISRGAIEKARELYEHIGVEPPKLILSDIFDIAPGTLPGFDLIVIRDVFEHIHGHMEFLEHLSGFLKPGGRIFLGFPPFMMPFAGHQQICVGRVASRLPYYHLLPRRIYGWILKMLGESDGKIEGLLEIKDTRIHLWKFHKLVKRSPLEIVKENLYLINPNYETKFGLSPRRLPWVMNIPVIREFFITTCYIMLTRK